MDFSNAQYVIKESMFPIFALALNINTYIMKGTGFFIDNNGLFVSVSHVFERNNPDLRYYFHGFYPEKKFSPIEIKEVLRDERKDLYIGRIEEYSGPKLELLNNIITIGTSVCLGGYPNPDKVDSLTNISSFWIQSSVCNLVHFKNNIYNLKAYLIDGLAIECMSGGPVFNTDGYVIGMIIKTNKSQKKTIALRSETIFKILAKRSGEIGI